MIKHLSEYRVKPSEYKIKASQPMTKHGLISIEGYASTNDVDSYNEIVEPTAFNSSLAKYMENPILLFGHHWNDKPIGKIVSAHIDKRGLYVIADIIDTAEGRDVAKLVEAEILKCFSIGFMLKRIEITDDDGEPNIIKDLELLETSTVNIGACPTALFTEAKSKRIELETLVSKSHPKGGRINMLDSSVKDAISAVEKNFGGLQTSVETVSSEIGDIRKQTDGLAKDFKQMSELTERLKTGTITQDEFTKFTDGVAADFLKLQDSVEKKNNLDGVRKTRFAVRDWKSLLSDTSWMKRDDGTVMSEMEVKSYNMFEAPVDYDSHPDGNLLKHIRDLHDHVTLSIALQRGRHHGADPTHLKSYQDLIKLVEYFDADFSKAMSTGASSGGPWIPTGLSSEVHELMRLQPSLINRFPNFDAPTDPYNWPLLTGGATAYRATEAAVDNPAELKKSNVSTSKVTFNAELLAVLVQASPSLTEDSLVPMVSVIRSEIVRAADETIESALVNGDTTATHRDTTDAWTSDSFETAWNGLRYQAIDDGATFDSQSVVAGVGDGTAAFAAMDARYCRELVSDQGGGVDPSKGFYIANIATWFKMINFTEVTKANEFGMASTWLTGKLPALDGSEIYVSTKSAKTLNTTGVNDGGGGANQSMLLYVLPEQFKVANCRGVTVEFEKNIKTQQWAFVATRRLDFQKMSPSTQKPVSAALNIETP